VLNGFLFGIVVSIHKLVEPVAWPDSPASSVVALTDQLCRSSLHAFLSTFHSGGFVQSDKPP
jgi:hypothetical protein